MTEKFNIGDRVRPTNSLHGGGAGVIVQCQPASVYRVHWSDGSDRYYSEQQLERVESSPESARVQAIPFTEPGRESCN
jgi:hypothetical protein